MTAAPARSDTRLDTYAAWHQAQLRSGDLDPAYPVLRGLAAAWSLTQDQICWLLALHVAYYHLGSALVAFSRTDASPAGVPSADTALERSGLLRLPCATERRGHRSRPPLARHLRALADTHRFGGWSWYRGDGWDWSRLTDRLVEVPGNGRWAAYKTAELVQKVAGAPLIATDAGHRYSTGPRQGLELLFTKLPPGQGDAAIATLDRKTAWLARRIGEPDVAQVETSLCDFHALSDGRYYLGHDIDAMADQLTDRRVPDATPQAVWDIRASAFDASLLGEVNGWIGVRPRLRRLYRDTGCLDWRDLS